MIKDALGDRMKKYYEEVSKTRLVRRMPVIIRLDGKAFHTFTRGMKKPFDEVFNNSMQQTMEYLCKNIQGCVLGYTQSDEITLVLIDYQTLQTDAWFDYEIQKMTSISASMATLAFNKFFETNVNKFKEEISDLAIGIENKYLDTLDNCIEKGAFFDSRCFNIPREEVTNCILWRQLDAERNSINALAQSLFSHKSLQGLSRKETVAKMELEKGVIWGNFPTMFKRGSCCIRDEAGHWFIDKEIPIFKEDGRNYIEKLIQVGE